MSVSLVIFDCDGTLVDSEAMNIHALSALLTGFGFSQFTFDFCHDHYKSLTLPVIVADAAARTGFSFPTDMLERIVAIKREMIPQHVTAIEGADALIESAAARFDICVASNGERESVLTEMEHTGLLRHFRPEDILTADQFAHGKPDPAMFLEAARRFGAEPAQCLVIEDGLPGIFAARALGMPVWGFTGTAADPASMANRMEQEGAQPVFDSLIHMRMALEALKTLA